MGKAIQFSQKCSRRRVPPNSRGATATVRLCPLRALRPPPTHATHMLITTLTQETQKSENQKVKNGAKNESESVYFLEKKEPHFIYIFISIFSRGY